MNNFWSCIKEKCQKYLLEETNAIFKSEIKTLLSTKIEKNQQELFDRMGSYLKFGTAGLRGKMEAGYNRMNIVSVYRCSYAVGLEFCSQPHAKIVIGFDGRKNSKKFAYEAAAILGAMGAKIYLFNNCVPTPICAFATKEINALAAVMITASHNPSYDNGIKLFNGNGAQVFGEILVRIENNMSKAPLRIDFIKDNSEKINSFNPVFIGDEIFSSYLSEIKRTHFFSHEQVDRDVAIVYTPLHGVGKNYFCQALLQEGFDQINVVKEQAIPDGRFPTLIFPNPEENNTLDYAHKLALSLECQWVFANDPDADRLQVSTIDASKKFRKLSGNEMGAILGYFAILRAKKYGIKPLLASSIVSSRMLKNICLKLNAKYVDSLTGFGNIINAAIQKEKDSDYEFVFGYEEAIGFLVDKIILDKDGIHAGVRFMEIIGFLKKEKKTVWQLLDELYTEFGIFVNSQWSLRFDGITALENMKEFMQRARFISTKVLANCFDESECQKFDLNAKQELHSYKGLRANILIFEIKDAVRFIIRPSGTEPKIKFYLELCAQATNSDLIPNKRMKILLEKNILDFRTRVEALFKFS
jgi:phosphomannomutase